MPLHPWYPGAPIVTDNIDATKKTPRGQKDLEGILTKQRVETPASRVTKIWRNRRDRLWCLFSRVLRPNTR
jgi:hypothetical protein